eukprot:1622825-Pleurochrysis_carterae.AAC.1
MARSERGGAASAETQLGPPKGETPCALAATARGRLRFCDQGEKKGFHGRASELTTSETPRIGDSQRGPLSR